MFELFDLKDAMESLEESMDLIYDEWGRYFSTSKEVKMAKIRASILDNSEFPKMYILKKDNELVGSFTIKDKDLSNCDLSPWLVCVIIKKEHRGKGYANVLLSYIKKIIDNSYKKMYLTTSHVGFYEKIGFEFVKLVDHNGEIEKLYEYKG